MNVPRSMANLQHSIKYLIVGIAYVTGGGWGWGLVGDFGGAEEGAGGEG